MWKWMNVCWFLFVTVWAAPVEGRADPAKVDSVLAAAADTLLDEGEREGLLKKALKYDRTGRAMHALARFYMAQGTPASRQTAGNWLTRAVQREPENAVYLATFAELLWRSLQRPNAYRKAREALALDPDNVEALYWAGRFVVWSWEMSYFTEEFDEDEARMPDENTFIAGQTLRYAEYADLDLDLGVAFLSRAIRADPDHWPSHLHLGLSYYAAKMPDRLVGLFEAYRTRHPESRDAHFFVGLGHQMNGDLEAAYRAYVEGLNRVTGTERLFMQSIFMLRDRRAEERGEPLPDEAEIQRFWFGKDPLFSTPVNERLMEQCRRVAYANLRFSDPMNGYEGWETDRGQAYIRYGDPVARYMIPPGVDLGLRRTPGEESRMPRTRSRTGWRTEVWSYEGFEVTFVNTNTWDSWRFGPAKLGYRTVHFDELAEALPDYYRHPFQYAAPYQAAQFRQDDGQTRVEVYYALPGGKVNHREVGPGIRAVDVRQALFLFDADWDTLRHEVGRVARMPWVVYASTDQGFLFAGERLTLAPGDYFLAGEAEDRATKQVGTFREALKVRRFGRDSLEISSLLMGRRIVEREGAPYGREQFLVLPNPLKRCAREGEAWFYFEVYNLSRDNFGSTHYRVSYQVQALPEERVMGAPEPEWTTAVSYTYRGDRAWEARYLRLDMDGASPGLRAFRVAVEDLQSGREVVAMTQFRVGW